jgi:hypothetical protein
MLVNTLASRPFGPTTDRVGDIRRESRLGMT